MPTALRNIGLDVVGGMPFGTHFAHLYDTATDLLETLVPYIQTGLESNECCVWAVSDPLSVDEAWRALQQAIPDLDRHLRDERVEILDARDWYLQHDRFDMARVTEGWNSKMSRALARGYDGMRVTGSTAWLESRHWHEFMVYEQTLNQTVVDQQMLVLCSYPLGAIGAVEVLDVMRNHQFVVAKRDGAWETLENHVALPGQESRAAATAPLRAEPVEPIPATVVPESTLRHLERRNILGALEQAGWEVDGPGGAAAILGMHPSTLAARITALGIERPRDDR